MRCKILPTRLSLPPRKARAHGFELIDRHMTRFAALGGVNGVRMGGLARLAQ